MMAIAVIIYCFSTFTPPIAINGLLAYIETDGWEATIRPWLWVAIMFFGPLVTSLSLQWYIYYSATAFFRAEAMLVQLIFEHSLRIRLKADDGAERSKKNPEPEGPNGKGDAENMAESPSGTDADSVTEVASQTEGSVSRGRGKSPTQTVEGQAGDEEKETKKDHLIGKINTLITVDIGNIVDAKDWLTLG